MLDTFLALIDRAIALLEFRGRRREEVFSQIIEPLFRELEPVVEDYFGLFRVTLDIVKSGSLDSSDLKDRIPDIEARREAMWVVRNKVGAMAQALLSTEDVRIISFGEAIVNFFYRSHKVSRVPGGCRSYSGDLLGVLEMVDAGICTREDAAIYIERTISMMRDLWFEISRLHAELRLYCMSTGAFKKL